MKNDSISRQAAIETVKKHYRGFDNDLLEIIAYEMEELPPTQLAQDLSNGCTDTISRAAALNLIEQSCCDLEYACDNVALRKEVKELPPVTPKQPGWIPVTEKPIEGGQYIVTLKDDKEVWTDIAEWNPTFGGRWQAEFFDCEYRDIDNVVAWQPLPTPYRERGQDGED